MTRDDDELHIDAIATASATSAIFAEPGLQAKDYDLFADVRPTEPPCIAIERTHALRIRCLEFAHQGDRVGRSHQQILDRARAFEAYVTGENEG